MKQSLFRQHITVNNGALSKAGCRFQQPAY